MQTPGKVFNDPIHGHVELHPLLIKIIDTPQFQRLRNIKQLGAAYFVYPGASHNRFEHSIGVGHLAGELVKVLKERQPELGIDDRDVLCVQIAGLCHDLGHGPFSHLYDQIFIPKTKQPDENIKWKHEMASCAMFDHLVDSNNLKPVMEEYGLKLSKDLVFIKEMIAKPLDTTEGQEWPYQGRPVDKSFLYEIVANEINGVDVDKFDYFARDCHHLGLQSNFNHRRFLTFARVCEVDGQKHICTRDKEEDNMLEMFHTRMCLHKRAYQHKVNKIIETMIADAFLKADGHIQFEGSGGNMFTLSTAIRDMEAYTKLTDCVFEKILNSSTLELADAREILKRIISRNLYRFLGEMQTEIPTKKCKDMTGEWKNELAEVFSRGNDMLTPEDFEIHLIKIDYGKKDKNPVDFINFYSKNDYTNAFKMKKSKFRPKHFSEQWVRFYCKKRMQDDQNLEAHENDFDQWCKGSCITSCRMKSNSTVTPELITEENI